MPICPNCHTEQTKRKFDSCPECLTLVDLVTMKDGTKLWVRKGEQNPNTQLLNHWMEKLSERLSADAGRPVNYNLHPMKQAAKYRKELAWAEDFLMQADWDLDLAKATITKVVADWFKPLVTLAWAQNEYPVALAITMSEMNADNNTAVDYAQKRLKNLEDVWA